MELNWLNTFTTVVHSGSFASAAEKLRYARSTVTHQIQCLERDLGVELFDRKTAGQPLTEAGHLLVPHARAVTERITATRANLLRAAQDDQSVRLGVTDATQSYWLSHFMRSTDCVLPEIRFQVEIAPTDRLETRLLQGDLDLNLVAVRAGQNLTGPSRKLGVEHAVFALPSNGNNRDESPRRIVTSPPGCPYRELLEEEYLRHHPGTRVVEVGSVEGVRSCVLGGIGAGVVPYGLVRSELANGTIRHRHWSRLTGETEVRIAWSPESVAGPLAELLEHIGPATR